MSGFLRFNLKYSLGLIFAALFLNLQGQVPEAVDVISNKIFNQDFEGVPEKIKVLQRTSPQMAKYIKVDYLWWKMISDNTQASEAALLFELYSLTLEKGDKMDYDQLIYFTYQIRYDNFKKKNLSKYLNLLKLHFFLEKIDSDEIRNSDPFVLSLFTLMTDFDLFMRYKFFSNHGFQTEKNHTKCMSCLDKIEMQNEFENKTFKNCKTYLLGKIYLDIENDYSKANFKFEKLSEMFPGNMIFKKTAEYCRAKLYSRSAR